LLDSLKLDSALVHYNVGSLLHVWDVAFTTFVGRTVGGRAEGQLEG
jgi:hypothetical protein